MDLSELRTWLTGAGLAGKSETVLLDGFCPRAMPACRSSATPSSSIPCTRWMKDGLFFGAGKPGRRGPNRSRPTREGEAAENWRRSVFFHLLETGGSLFRVRFHVDEAADFSTIVQMRNEGMTDAAAMITRFPGSGAIGEMDSLYSYWATDRPHGFDDAQVEAVAGYCASGRR
jgi:adenylate cyclase